jgi:hypothetical protein
VLSRLYRVATSVVVLLTLHASAASAQTRPRDHLAMLATDSVAWQRVLAYVIGSLASDLVATSADTVLQPWSIRLPAAEPQRALLERQMRTLVRARTPLPSDSVVRALELGPLVILGDTGYVRVQFSLTRRCAGSSGTTGYDNVDSVLVPRHPQLRAWGAARSAGVRHGDRVGCPRG